jgi:hypothetical protein
MLALYPPQTVPSTNRCAPASIASSPNEVLVGAGVSVGVSTSAGVGTGVSVWVAVGIGSCLTSGTEALAPTGVRSAVGGTETSIAIGTDAMSVARTALA